MSKKLVKPDSVSAVKTVVRQGGTLLLPPGHEMSSDEAPVVELPFGKYAVQTMGFDADGRLLFNGVPIDDEGLVGLITDKAVKLVERNQGSGDPYARKSVDCEDGTFFWGTYYQPGEWAPK